MSKGKYNNTMVYLFSRLLESALMVFISLLFHEDILVLSFLLIYCTLRPTLGEQRPKADMVCALLIPTALGAVRFGSDADFPGRLSLGPGCRFSCRIGGKNTEVFIKHFGAPITKEAMSRCWQPAHEIRTPLTIMQTTENVLMEQIAGPLNARQKKFMESIFINTHRLITFSENMLTLLKLERDWQPDLSKHIDLRLIIRQVADTMQPMLLVKHQQITYSFPSLLSRPKADEAWIRQVLINLVHNASKHTDEQGTILITVTQDDQQVVVTVTDTGHGLLGGEREALFKEFYQENKNPKEFQDGFGLGLSIVRSIIERHHGKVYITSTKEMGTMVSFNLPAEASR